MKFLTVFMLNVLMAGCCFGQDSINKPSICLSLSGERISMRHNFTGTVNQRYKTPLILSPKGSFYVRSVKGRALKIDMGLIQYSDPSGIDNYPTLQAYGYDKNVLSEDLGALSFLNTNVLWGRRFHIFFGSNGKIPFDAYYGLNFQVPIFREDGNFYVSPLEREARGSQGETIYRESRTVKGLMPRFCYQLQKEFKLTGNMNWYLGFNWVQAFAPFLQKEWWIEDQGIEQDRLGLSYTGSYFGFEFGLRGLL